MTSREFESEGHIFHEEHVHREFASQDVHEERHQGKSSSIDEEQDHEEELVGILQGFHEGHVQEQLANSSSIPGKPISIAPRYSLAF